MRRRNILRTSVALPIALATRRRAAAQPNIYRQDWDSIDRRPTPRWYSDAKFGIFIHWGVYSVPAFAAVNVKDENPYAEWYWNSLTNGMKAKGPTGNGALTWAFHKRIYGPDFTLTSISRRCFAPRCTIPINGPTFSFGRAPSTWR